MRPDADIDVTGAMRAFDLLATDGPRLVMNELRTMANESKFHAEMHAPGGLARGWRVEAMADPVTNDVFGYAAAPSDKPAYGGKPVARWVDRGTGAQATRGIDANPAYEGQRAQRFVRKPSKRKQMEMVHKALLRAARRSGFDVGGPG